MEQGIYDPMVPEQDPEDHADRDDIGDVRHEEDGLEKFLEGADRMDGQGDEQGKED